MIFLTLILQAVLEFQAGHGWAVHLGDGWAVTAHHNDVAGVQIGDADIVLFEVDRDLPRIGFGVATVGDRVTTLGIDETPLEVQRKDVRLSIAPWLTQTFTLPELTMSGQSGRGVWNDEMELVGILVAISESETFVADFEYYDDEIKQIVPEPSVLWLALGGASMLIRRVATNDHAKNGDYSSRSAARA